MFDVEKTSQDLHVFVVALRPPDDSRARKLSLGAGPRRLLSSSGAAVVVVGQIHHLIPIGSMVLVNMLTLGVY
jgi:hypothetical protein